MCTNARRCSQRVYAASNSSPDAAVKQLVDEQDGGSGHADNCGDPHVHNPLHATHAPKSDNEECAWGGTQLVSLRLNSSPRYAPSSTAGVGLVGEDVRGCAHDREGDDPAGETPVR